MYVKILTEEVPSLESYLLIASCVLPRPIAWVTSASKGGIINAAPFSFFNVVCIDPPMVMIAVSKRRGEQKDTSRNISESRTFVVNIVNESLAETMNLTSADFPSTVSEIERAGLTLAPSTRIPVPGIQTSPIRLECELHTQIELGKAETDVIIGKVVVFHIDDEVMTEGRIDARKLKAIGRLGGSNYCRTTELFRMERPKKP